jgi:pimeloyl-ACP methyl ester carboxylesterase
MATIVLVHGAWQGEWCWERVVPLLERAGHDVRTPTLTGCGVRAAELGPQTTLDTHVAEIASLVGDLGGPVLLVGHSYAGMVVSAVADAMADRLAGLVFLDAFYPYDGESALSLMPPPFQDRFRSLAADQGDGWRLPANDGLLDVWGLHDPADRQWVRERLSDWSLPCFETPVRLPTGGRGRVLRTHVAGAGEQYPARAAFAPFAARARDDGARVVELPTGHDMMVEAPDDVAKLLLEAAGGA